jgi:hypothetical protein
MLLEFFNLNICQSVAKALLALASDRVICTDRGGSSTHSMSQQHMMMHYAAHTNNILCSLPQVHFLATEHTQKGLTVRRVAS